MRLLLGIYPIVFFLLLIQWLPNSQFGPLLGLAQSQELSVDIQCAGETSEVFVPSLNYRISIQSNTGKPKIACQTQLSLSYVVNRDVVPSTTCTYDVGFLTIHHPTPKMKITGLQCILNDRVQLQASGDGLDYPPVDIAIQAPHSTSWRDAYQIDHLLPSEPVTLFGLGGKIASEPLRDGFDDDHQRNGEVVFGSTLASGGTETVIRYHYGRIRANDQVAQNILFVFSIE